MYVCAVCMYVGGKGGSTLCCHSTHTHADTYSHSETGNSCEFSVQTTVCSFLQKRISFDVFSDVNQNNRLDSRCEAATCE